VTTRIFTSYTLFRQRGFSL